MVYALQIFQHYLLGGHFNMFIDHSALKYLVNKTMLGGNICQWILLFQEFEFEIIVKLGRLNTGPDHLSRLENEGEPTNLDDNIHDAQLFVVKMVDGYYEDIVHLLTIGRAPTRFKTT